MVKLQLFRLPLSLLVSRTATVSTWFLFGHRVWCHQTCSQPQVLELLTLRLTLLQGEEFLPVLYRKEALEIWEGRINGVEIAIFPSAALQERSQWQKSENAASWCWLLLPYVSGRTLVLGSLYLGPIPLLLFSQNLYSLMTCTQLP